MRPAALPTRTVVAAGVAVALVGALTSCAQDEPAAAPTRTVVAQPSPSRTSPPEPAGTPSATTEPSQPADIRESSSIATARTTRVDVHDAPDGAVVRTLEAADVVSLPGRIPLTFLVAQEQDGWVQVHLPVRPNGSTGWLRASDVTTSTTPYHLEVRLTEHRLLLHRSGEVVLDVPVGVGRDEVPTPGGVYYVKELLQPPDQGGVYGAYAYGLSGFSPVLTSFAGGEGVIGIHGTNQPDSIGTDASHGCIRMHDADVTRLVEEFGLPLGTPVSIVA